MSRKHYVHAVHTFPVILWTDKIGAALTNSIALSTVSGHKERSLAGNIPVLHTGTTAKQQVHAVHVIVECSYVEGRASPVVPQVYDWWPEVSDQQLQALFTALEAGRMRCYYSSLVMDDFKKTALHAQSSNMR